MSEKRRDSKGRVLRTGEVQRTDGKYMFRYIDANGARKTVYSWRLVDTDKIPNGKRFSESLRSIERRVLKDTDDGIVSSSTDVTVNSLFDKFFEMRHTLAESTKCNYICLYDMHVRERIGKKPIQKIKYSDMYKLYLSFSTDDHLKISTIQALNGILWQMFNIAVKDHIIRNNPTDGLMQDISKALNEEKKKRHALTIGQQSALLDYIYSKEKYSRYGTLFTTLLGTGMRIGEALGLRWSDVDFNRNIIIVDHSLSYKSALDGKYKYKISPPKTSAGIRSIPMFSDVRDALQRQRESVVSPKSNFSIGQYTDFIFLNTAGKVYTPTFIFDLIQNIVADYNHEEYARARTEGDEPLYLPKISAHILRHTFCTRLCENEPNLKVVQDVMGHKNITTTMNIYNEATSEAKQVSFANIDGKIKLR